MKRLRLEIDPGTANHDGSQCRGIHFYESSVPHERTGAPLVSIIKRGRGDGMRLNPGQVVELRDWLDGWLKENVTHELSISGRPDEPDWETSDGSEDPCLAEWVTYANRLETTLANLKPKHEYALITEPAPTNKGANMEDETPINREYVRMTPEEMLRAVFGPDVNIFNIDDLAKKVGPRIMGEMFSNISHQASDIFTVVHHTHRGLMSDISGEIADTMARGSLIPENWPAVMQASFDLYEATLNAAKPGDAEDVAMKDEALAMLADLRKEAKLPPSQDHSELARGVLVDYGLGEPGTYTVEVTETGLKARPTLSTAAMGLDEYVRAYGPSCSRLDCSHEHCARIRSLRVREDEASLAGSATLTEDEMFNARGESARPEYGIRIPVDNWDGVSVLHQTDHRLKRETIYLQGGKQSVQAFVHNLRRAANQAWYEVNQ